MVHTLVTSTPTVLEIWSRRRLTTTSGFAQPKPKWVCNEVIRLKAVMPQAGCRTIAYHFNEAKNGVSS